MNPQWSTVALQAVNVLILVWLLGRLFWRPLAGMIRQRQDEVTRALDDARAQRTQVQAELARIQAEADAVQAARVARLAAVQDEADALRAAQGERLQAEARALREAAEAEAARQVQAQAAAQRALAEQLAVDIAGRLAARLDGDAVRAAFRTWLVQAVAALDPRLRDALVQHGVEIVSAAPLDEPERQRCAEALQGVLGVAPRMQWSVDPQLIAGLELRGHGLRVANSWRADLDAMRAALEQGSHG